MDGQMLYKIPVTEMATHLAARVTHHQKRADDYAHEAEKVEQSLGDALGSAETVTDRMSIKSSHTYSNEVSRRDQLRGKVQVHARLATFFAFIQGHLPDPREQRPLEMIRVGDVVSVGGHGRDDAGAYLLSVHALRELEFVQQ